MTQHPIQKKSYTAWRTLTSLAVIAAFPVLCTPAHADELSDLKAQIQLLSQRLSHIEAEEAAKKNAPAPVLVVPAAAAPMAPELLTDQQGVPLGDASSVTLYSSSDTSLKVYGLLEATISRASNQNAKGDPATGFQTAWFSGNRLGFDAQHALAFGSDIGLPGLKIISKLETEFELPTGNSDTENVLFNRDAWLGFYSPDLGKVTLGRQNTLTRDFTQNWGDAYGTPDVTLKESGYSNVNNFKQLIFYSGSANGTRVNSAIEWKKDWDGHWVTGLGYAFGSAGAGGSGDVGNGGSLPGDFSRGTTQEASVAYNRLALGPGVLNANLSYDRANVQGLIHESELLGGNFTIAGVRLNGGLIHYTAQQGPGNDIGNRTDNSWTTSVSFFPLPKTEFSLGYQEMKGSHAGFNAGGVTLNPFGNTSGVVSVANGGKDTLYGALMFHADRNTDFYLAADYFKVTGDWVVGDAQGNGNHYGVGQPHQNETELATGVRFKF